MKTKLYVIIGLAIVVLAAGYGYRDSLDAALTSGSEATSAGAGTDAKAPEPGRGRGRRGGRGRGGPVPVVVVVSTVMNEVNELMMPWYRATLRICLVSGATSPV